MSITQESLLVKREAHNGFIYTVIPRMVPLAEKPSKGCMCYIKAVFFCRTICVQKPEFLQYLTRELLLVGAEQCPALADSRLVQSLGAEWTREPKLVPGQGSSNTGLVQICAAVRGEPCYPFVCVWAGVLLAWTSLAINVSLRKRTLVL